MAMTKRFEIKAHQEMVVEVNELPEELFEEFAHWFTTHPHPGIVQARVFQKFMDYRTGSIVAAMAMPKVIKLNGN
jgi:hypothetical protein